VACDTKSKRARARVFTVKIPLPAVARMPQYALAFRDIIDLLREKFVPD
jgi:hypothetical protein